MTINPVDVEYETVSSRETEAISAPGRCYARLCVDPGCAVHDIRFCGGIESADYAVGLRINRVLPRVAIYVMPRVEAESG